MELEISLDDDRWAQVRLPDLADRGISETLQHLGLDGDIEISVLACDDLRIAELNADFRGKDVATNVLSWPAQDLVPPALPSPDPDGSLALGDIAIAFDTCQREAIAQDKPFAAHVIHLLVHATLHLFGYDHIRDAEATHMERIEVEILGKLGLPDPYK